MATTETERRPNDQPLLGRDHMKLFTPTEIAYLIAHSDRLDHELQDNPDAYFCHNCGNRTGFAGGWLCLDCGVD